MHRPQSPSIPVLSSPPTELTAFICPSVTVLQQAGVAAGIPVIGFTTGQPPEVLREAGACHVCTDFSDIVAMIKAEN